LLPKITQWLGQFIGLMATRLPEGLLQHGRLGVGVLLEEVLGPHPVHVVVVVAEVPLVRKSFGSKPGA